MNEYLDNEKTKLKANAVKFFFEERRIMFTIFNILGGRSLGKSEFSKVTKNKFEEMAQKGLI